LVIGGALLVVMVGATVAFSPPGEQFNSPIPSSYSAQSAGAEAAYLMLAQLHYPVRRWEDSPVELQNDAGNVLLILAEPVQPPSEKERKALVSFVEDGGHVLFTGELVNMFFTDANVSRIPPDPDWKTFSPSIPSRLANAAQHVTMQPLASWGKLSESQLALYGDLEAPGVIRWKIGDGEVLWWAGSTPLTNAGITRDDNLAFFVSSVANWSAGEPYQIYWDEYFHGQRSSLWSYFGKTSIAWGLLQLVFLAVAVLFSFSRRSGPIFVPAGTSRLWPLEFVDTLGGLYERAGAASSAVSVSYLRLRFLLTRQLGMSANTPDAELGLAAVQRLGWKDSGLADLLGQAARSSRMAKLSPREALEQVQKLERYAAKLDVRAQSRQEKA
jgi:hypothetical protein